MTTHPEIAEAIRLIGSQPRLAECAGLSQQHISKMLRRERVVSAEVAVRIEAATNSAIPRWKLRPDLWEAPAEVA